jgi:hypothetical protein
MKRSLLLFALATASAFAFGQGQALPTPTSIRTAQAHAFVFKYEVVRVVDGKNETDTYTRTKVCETEGAIPVYDFTLYKDGYQGPDTPSFGSCATTLNGDPVTVAVYGNFGIYDMSEWGEKLQKSVSGSLAVTSVDKDHPVAHNGGYTNTATTTMNEPSLVITVFAKSDAPAESLKYETLAVDIEFTDAPAN